MPTPLSSARLIDSTQFDPGNTANQRVWPKHTDSFYFGNPTDPGKNLA